MPLFEASLYFCLEEHLNVEGSDLEEFSVIIWLIHEARWVTRSRSISSYVSPTIRLQIPHIPLPPSFLLDMPCPVNIPQSVCPRNKSPRMAEQTPWLLQRAALWWPLIPILNVCRCLLSAHSSGAGRINQSIKCHLSADLDGLSILTQGSGQTPDTCRHQVLNPGQERTTKEQATFTDNDCTLTYCHDPLLSFLKFTNNELEQTTYIPVILFLSDGQLWDYTCESDREPIPLASLIQANTAWDPAETLNRRGSDWVTPRSNSVACGLFFS